MSNPRRLAAVLFVAPLVLLAACGGDDEPSAETDGDAGPIAVTASDDACEVAVDEAEAGTISFTVTNTGTKVNEFYLYAEGDRIMGEVENIGPGLTREFLVEVTEGGEYETACKPGMVGDGIRNAFTVTGSAGEAKDEDARLLEATVELSAVREQPGRRLAGAHPGVRRPGEGRGRRGCEGAVPGRPDVLGADRTGGGVLR